MTVTTVEKNPEALTMAITAELDAPVDRAWQLWADPRQLERWWGPPGYPSTFTTHQLEPGGHVAYYMTSPEGERYHGYWKVLETDPPRRLVFLDGFAHDDGRPNDDLPKTTSRVSLEDAGDGRTRMVVASVFPDAEAMEKVLAMGAEEGLRQAIGQIDAILAEDSVRSA